MKEILSRKNIPTALLIFSLLSEAGCASIQKTEPHQPPEPLKQISETVKKVEEVVGDTAVTTNDASGIVNLMRSIIADWKDILRIIK